MLAGCGEPWGLERETALRLARALGSGMSAGDICGAVNAGGMVLGLVQGSMAPDDPDTRRRVKEQNREFQRRFRAVHGTIVCRELLGVDPDDREGFDGAIDKGHFKARCGSFVATAARILEEMLGNGPAGGPPA